jgi:uncharacterized protein (TIGR02246 family)
MFAVRSILTDHAAITMGDSMTEYERTGNDVDLKAIDVVRDAHVAALNAGDARAWAAQFADDAVQMPPNAPANVGGAQIASWSQAFLDLFRVHFALAVAEVRVLGEWAFERGTYTISLTSQAGGPTMQDIGKYLTVYQRKSGNTWRMARDIWNSNSPPAM